MKRTCLVIAAMLVTSLAACGGGGGATYSTGTGTGTGTGAPTCTAGSGTICVLAISFNPVDMTIAKGTSAVWVWQQGAHNIVFDAPLSPGVDDIGAFSDGSVSRTFTTAGTYPYHCTIHGGPGTGMHGTITVQ